MNIFRLAGDMSHVFSIIILLLRLKVAKNANGACPASRPPAIPACVDVMHCVSCGCWGVVPGLCGMCGCGAIFGLQLRCGEASPQHTDPVLCYHPARPILQN